jgi:hypothetical protein
MARDVNSINDSETPPLRFEAVMDEFHRITVTMDPLCTRQEVLGLCIRIAYACEYGLPDVTFCQSPRR